LSGVREAAINSFGQVIKRRGCSQKRNHSKF